MPGRRAVRSRGRWCPAERCLETFEQARQGVCLWWWQVGEEAGEPFAQGRLRRAKGPLTVLGEGDGESAAVVLETVAREHSGSFECSEELRDGRRGHRGAAGELGSEDLAFGNRLQCQVLGDGKGRVVRREQTLNPAAHQRRSADERLGGLPAITVVRRSPH